MMNISMRECQVMTGRSILSSNSVLALLFTLLVLLLLRHCARAIAVAIAIATAAAAASLTVIGLGRPAVLLVLLVFLWDLSRVRLPRSLVFVAAAVGVEHHLLHAVQVDGGLGDGAGARDTS